MKKTGSAGLGSHNSCGLVLIEALIAFLLLAVGLIVLLSFHAATQKTNAEAKIQAEAVALAEAKLQELESFLSQADARLNAGQGGDAPSGQLLTFNRSWVIANDATNANLVIAEVTVNWQDRHGNPQNVILNSAINRQEPTNSAANFLALVDKTNAAADSATWGDGQGAEDDPEPPDDTPAPGDDDPQNPDPDPVPEVTVYELTISGSITGGPGNVTLDTEIENATIDAYLVYPASCTTPTNRTFNCKVKYSNQSAGWSGEIELTTNRMFCQTLSSKVILTFAGITANQSGISLVVANNANQCG